MVTRIFLTLFLALIITCHAEPPSRLNLFRFFMGFGPETSTVQNISFNPEAGLRYREQYEKKYGPRGSLLIERFGKGLGPEEPHVTDIIETSKPEMKYFVNQDLNPPKSKSKKDTRGKR